MEFPRLYTNVGMVLESKDRIDLMPIGTMPQIMDPTVFENKWKVVYDRMEREGKLGSLLFGRWLKF